MVAVPILLFFLVFPIAEWDIDGRRVSYEELWLSGQGAAIALWLLLPGVGAWGLAARSSKSRWLLVLAPIAPFLLPGAFPGARLDSEAIVSGVLTAAIAYFCLFHLRSVRAYLSQTE